MIGDAFRVYQVHVKSNASFIKGHAKPKKSTPANCSGARWDKKRRLFSSCYHMCVFDG